MLSENSKNKLKVVILIGVAVATINIWYGGELSGSAMRRALSINLGGGDCEWKPAIQFTDEGFPTDEKLTKTIIAGFPSGDKRLTYLQLEGLTGLSARDEWDFEFLGMTNQPFIKANYPHHEGIWGWRDVGDQIVMVVSDIKKVMIEYHDILWDLGFAQNFEEAYERVQNLYNDNTGIPLLGGLGSTWFTDANAYSSEDVDENAPLAEFLVWRDLRVFDEIHWYSWFIEYYMESGLMRDMFNHKMTVPSQWALATLPNFFTKHEMRHGRFVDEDEVVTPSYDPMCATITSGCYPVLVIDPEKLVDPIYGPAESRKLAKVVNGTEGFDSWMIDEEAWECVWSELIIERKGAKTFLDKEIDYDSYTYSFEMKNEMWHQIDRLIKKFEVQTDQIAKDLVEILRGHRDALDVDTPIDPISYEELMSYHLAFPPFFPNQKPFSSDDDFFVRTHERWADPEAASVESIIDRRRSWFEEEMEKKRTRKVSIKYYDATGWDSLPTEGLESLTPYAESTTRTIRYPKTEGVFADSEKKDHVGALFQAYLRVDPIDTGICVTSDDGAKLFINDALLIDNGGVHGARKKCADISPGVHKFDLAYFEQRGKSALIVEFRGKSGDRVVPPRSWASSEGARRHRDLVRLSELLEEDLRNLKETDLMGPWTRAEFNRRKLATADPSEQKSKKYDMRILDKMLSDKTKKKTMSAGATVGAAKTAPRAEEQRSASIGKGEPRARSSGTGAPAPGSRRRVVSKRQRGRRQQRRGASKQNQ